VKSSEQYCVVVSSYLFFLRLSILLSDYRPGALIPSTNFYYPPFYNHPTTTLIHFFVAGPHTTT
jgi:hypothetical protein